MTYRNIQIQALIRRVSSEMVQDTMSDAKIASSFNVQAEKTHFIPQQYRVIGGLLQSLNIRFGNFLELLLREVINSDPNVSLSPLSGKRIALQISRASDAAIDRYITQRTQPNSAADCTAEFQLLLNEILANEKNSTDNKLDQKKDIDCLFVTKSNKSIFVELKYNDDHDTGKFVDIQRKLIKTYAGLVNELKIQQREKLEPYLWYFTPLKRWASIYLPETNVLRGGQLFEKYFVTNFQDVDYYLQNISEDSSMLELFDQLYQKVRIGRVVSGRLSR